MYTGHSFFGLFFSTHEADESRKCLLTGNTGCGCTFLSPLLSQCNIFGVHFDSRTGQLHTVKFSLLESTCIAIDSIHFACKQAPVTKDEHGILSSSDAANGNCSLQWHPETQMIFGTQFTLTAKQSVSIDISQVAPVRVTCKMAGKNSPAIGHFGHFGRLGASVTADHKLSRVELPY